MSQKCLGKHMQSKLVWTKGELTKSGWVGAGWKRTAINSNEQEYYKKKPTVLNEQQFFTRDTSEMDLFQDVQNEIQYGMAGDKIDDLPGMYRQMLDASDQWHITKSNKLFRVVDPETQAQDGQWGTDTDDSDIDALKERSSTARVFLEQSGIIDLDASQRSVTDILGSIEIEESGDKELQSAGFGTRVDIDVDRTSVTPEEAAIALIDGDDLEEMYSNANDEDTVNFNDPRIVNTALPELPKEVLTKVHELKAECDILLDKSSSEEEKEQIALIFELAVDKEINVYLTAPLNSPLCGRGYSPPRRKHEYIDVQKTTGVSIAATERTNFFNDLFKEASDCLCNHDLFGAPGTQAGFYGYIRNMNSHDRELSNKWSVKDRKDKDGNITISALNQKRTEYIRNWREENRGDEESLRVSVWAIFDRVAGTYPAEYSNGKLIKPRRIYKDSVWRKKRTIALQELFLTVGQWDAIYKILAVNKHRIKLNRGNCEIRQATLQTMKDEFIKIQNVHDLNEYMRTVEQRDFVYKSSGTTERPIKKRDGKIEIIKVDRGQKYNTYKFIHSMLDKISAVDEALWRKACARKRRYLEQRLLVFRSMNKSMKDSEDTELDNIDIECHDPRCGAMTNGKPKFAKLETTKVFYMSHVKNVKTKTVN